MNLDTAKNRNLRQKGVRTRQGKGGRGDGVRGGKCDVMLMAGSYLVLHYLCIHLYYAEQNYSIHEWVQFEDKQSEHSIRGEQYS